MNPEIILPLSADKAAGLRSGDEVDLTGSVFTARDQACGRLHQLISEGKALPIDLSGQLLYFVGPSPARPGQVIGSAGPTTSGRMMPFLPAFLQQGLRGFIGKGYLDQTVKNALVAHKSLYFGAIGGAGALLSGFIEATELIAFPELLSEAVHKLQLRRFPVVVLNDMRGGDLYAQNAGVSV